MLTCICGLPGAGKSTYLAKIAIECMINGRVDFLSCKREFIQLNSTGFNLDLAPQKHLVFCDTPIHFGRKLKTYYIDGFSIGLDNPFFDTTFIPPYSHIFLDEAQRYYDSRMSRYLRDDVYHWYQLHRHNDYNVYLACQRLANIDLNIRGIAERFLVMDKVEFTKNEYGIITKSKWHMTEFASCEIAEKYQTSNDNKDLAKYGKKITDSFDFNILSCYNSKSNRPVFYQNVYNSGVDYYTEDGYQFTRDSFVEFNNTHYFTAPRGFWKNAERDKGILKELGVINYGN